MTADFFQNPLVGLTLTIVVYCLMEWLLRYVRIPVLNPLILTVVFIIILLKVTGVSYDDYNKGADFLTMMITPATVALALPLYQNLDTLKKNSLPVLVATVVGIVTNVVLSIGIGRFFSLKQNMILSLLPKSVTTAISLDLSKQMGGISAVTLAIVVSTGILGALIGSHVFKLFRIKSPVARGIALGSTSHAIGTGRAIELGEVEGILSGLCICVNGIATVVLMPFLYNMINGLF
ncbi:LrgB family protein [Enterococcus mediterraneensis]|uniref:LrgB family protein n=1 Tax=Enterococcus mediterraneensis TaxID=2364791 RepID=UPI000F051495|nr:LrgB family protein [Enterococcus mediterraneensis]